MKIHNKEFRIVEKTYGDGHKEYHAEKLLINLLLFKIWKDYVYDVWDYGYGSITWKYRFHTYDECLDYLTKNLDEKYKNRQKNKLINTNIFR